MTVKAALAERGGPVEEFLRTCLHGQDIPQRLLASMEYSLMAGGKRLRPVLVTSWAQMLGAERDAVMPFAAALECIHTYSLIHDDLPAMDDDDLRRGKPSNHKQFDEATAILAGDALLTEAFGFMTRANADAANVLRAVQVMSHCAGAWGMVGGQMIDMELTGRQGVTLDMMRDMHARKTGALITAACQCGAILAGGSEADVENARSYGADVGVAFQIVDDVLDVVGDEATLGKPVGSDEEQGKNTYPVLLGLDESRKLAREYADAAVARLDGYAGAEKDFLAGLASYIVDRVY